MLSVPRQVDNSHPGELPCQPRSAQIQGLSKGWASRTLIQAVGRPGHLVCAQRPSMPP